MIRAASLILIALLALPFAGQCRTWYVRPDGTGDVPTIADAVNAASSGDTVLLADGVFTGSGNKGIVLHDKGNIKIMSESGDPEACIVDCGGSGTFITFDWYGGGAIYRIAIQNCRTAVAAGTASTASVVGCIIRNCSAYAFETWGSMGEPRGQINAHDCVISSVSGFALNCGYKCFMYMNGVLFVDNAKLLKVYAYSDCQIANCTIVNNGTSGGLIQGDFDSPFGYVWIKKSILAFNSDVVPGAYVTFELECCDIYGNTGGDYVGPISGMEGVNGNFSADPQFCNFENYDFTLGDCSPCLPGNHPDGYDCGRIGAFDAGCACENPTEPSTWGKIKSMYR